MTFDRDQAVARALASTSNVPDTCQLWTRTMFGVPSAGDLDGDGAADAEDGWKSEPPHARHPGDRTPPAGVPVSYLGGSHDNGHRAVSLGLIGGRCMIRSTDAGGPGVVATVPLDWPETHWGLRYAGWSETCDGVAIPLPPPDSRGENVDAAIRQVKVAAGRQPRHRAVLQHALRVLRSLAPFTRKARR